MTHKPFRELLRAVTLRGWIHLISAFAILAACNWLLLRYS